MTGTDEHGSKIQQAAANFKTDPQEYCDRISSEYRDLFKQFGVDYSRFIRTTSKDHINAVHNFWVSVKKTVNLKVMRVNAWK